MRGERWPHAPIPHPSRWTITARLLVLVLVPFTGLVAFGIQTTRGHLARADEAAAAEHVVDRLNLLVAARAALAAERVPAQELLARRRAGADPRDGATPADRDLVTRLAARRAGTDAVLDELGPTSPLPRTQVETFRAAVDRGPPGAGLDELPALRAHLDLAMRAGLAAGLTPDGSAVGPSEPADLLFATWSAVETADAVLDQLGAADRLAAGNDPDRSGRELAAAHSRQEVYLRLLDSIVLPQVTVPWQVVRADGTGRRYLDLSQQVARGDADLTGAGGPERAAQLRSDGLAFHDLLLRMIPGLAGTARGIAADLRADALDALRLGLAGPAAVALAGTGLALMFTRSLVKPYRRLAAHAAALGSGDLSVDPLPVRGPLEVTVAYQAFDELVANLRLLDAKGEALANLDLDAPVLAEPLPGRLGASISRSARAMSGSIDERDDLHRRLLVQATHDALTGLYNRPAAADALAQALTRIRDHRGVAVVHLDLDDFKRTNETRGNGAGDQVLRSVAEGLRTAAGESRFVARVAGDEFLVLVEGVDDPGAVRDLAVRLQAHAAQPVSVAGTTVALGASVGIAFTWDAREDAGQVLAWAELAVKRAKRLAPGTIEIYDRSLQTQLREQADTEAALRAALPGDELHLLYQPVVDLATGGLAGVEALVRWQRPGSPLRLPDSFIPVAERSELIVELDRWVMRHAAHQLAGWADTDELAAVPVAVNVSGRHLQGGALPAHVAALLDATGVDPGRLIVEITETVLVADLAVAAAQLDAVRRLGVRVALDDFGTGFTSITQLRQLPIDIIKIDRSFVQRLSDPRDRKLVALITELGHHLDLSITAEGVETADQYEILRELGCDRAQGHLMSRPLAPDDLAAWIGDRRRARVS